VGGACVLAQLITKPNTVMSGRHMSWDSRYLRSC